MFAYVLRGHMTKINLISPSLPPCRENQQKKAKKKQKKNRQHFEILQN